MATNKQNAGHVQTDVYTDSLGISCGSFERVLPSIQRKRFWIKKKSYTEMILIARVQRVYGGES